jgi:hypothetical protein
MFAVHLNAFSTTQCVAASSIMFSCIFSMKHGRISKFSQHLFLNQTPY